MQNVLILGGSGFIGKAIINEMGKHKEFDLYSTYFKNPVQLNKDRSFKLNIEDEDNISSILNASKPGIIISCLNGDYNKQLILHTKIAEYLKKTNGKLYFLSTINVFDSDFSRPHYEDDIIKSSTDYGQYKLECERKMIQILQDDVCILRLPQVFGKDSPRMNQLVKSLRNDEKVSVWPKLCFNTTTDLVVSKQLCYIIEHNLKGTFHLVAEDVINHKEFYKELILGLGFNNEVIEENLDVKGYFALLSRRYDEFPDNLRLTNKLVINYLLDCK